MIGACTKCGRTVFVATHNLVSGNMRSCGCFQADRTRAAVAARVAGT